MALPVPLLPGLFEVLVPNLLRDGDHALVEPLVVRLVAADQEHGLARRIEGVECSQRIALGLGAQFPQREGRPLDRARVRKAEYDPEGFKEPDGLGDPILLSFGEAVVPNPKFRP